MRAVWSVALTSREPFSPDLALRLLEANAGTAPGRWQIVRNGDGYRLLYCARVPATLGSERLGRWSRWPAPRPTG